MKMQTQKNKLHTIDRVNNLNIVSQQVLVTPHKLKSKLPIPQQSAEFVAKSRQVIADILSRKDRRKLAVVGPCSIHDIQSAKEYALKLKKLSEAVADELYVVMRVYFEKPRTTVGWKGLINDPDLNNSFNVEKGLETARELLLWLAQKEIPVATEMLDPICPQYISDLISWTAIGARTSESQTHREMASGLSMPIGIKNGTNGAASVAINAMQAASESHRFMGINQQGQVTLLNTSGNRDCHIILRGGKSPNYDEKSIQDYEAQLSQAGLPLNIMVDCSHGNSQKDFNKQTYVLDNIVQQICRGNQSIIGFMLESHLNAGNQKINKDISLLDYGVSITDACINWQTTETAMLSCCELLASNNAQCEWLNNGVTF
jgi:3-deoxy-7-phosphoheptulonate synthase